MFTKLEHFALQEKARSCIAVMLQVSAAWSCFICIWYFKAPDQFTIIIAFKFLFQLALCAGKHQFTLFCRVGKYLMIYKTKMGFIKSNEYKIAVAALCCNHFQYKILLFSYMCFTFTGLVHNKVIPIIELSSCSKRMKSPKVPKKMKQLTIVCVLNVYLSSTCN